MLHNSQADQSAALRTHLQELGVDPDHPHAHSLVPADLVYTATCRDHEVYILCEVSLTVEHDDLTKARDRSRTLTSLTGKPTLATVIGTALEVWPKSHWPDFALRPADVFQSYTAW